VRKIVSTDIVLGEAIPYAIYDENGILLLRQGAVITMPDQITRMVARGALFNVGNAPVKLGAPSASHPDTPLVPDDQSPFDELGGLILNLKHVMGTALKSPEQIDVTARIGKIALAVQQICHADIDAALAAPCFDSYNSYIVVHQMMGAVLTELVAHSKGLDQAHRLSLVCAALTRDLGQISIQAELDNHVGSIPDDLRARMWQHPNQSADLLAQAGVTDPLWLQAVRGHHDRLDGSGYPAGLKEDQVSVGARILAVADIYSAMVKPRPYRSHALFSQNALKEIYQKKDAEVDGEIVRMLISKVGLLPPGTIVKLKSGEIAVIKSPTVKTGEATVYSIYGKTGMILPVPIRRETAQPGNEITGLVAYADCRAATVTIKRIWAK